MSPSGLELEVLNASSPQMVGGATPAAGNAFFEVEVALGNVAADTSAQLTPSFFTLVTTESLEVSSSTSTVELQNACRADLAVGQGASQTCRVLYEVPASAVGAVIRYDNLMGLEAEGAVPALVAPTIPADVCPGEAVTVDFGTMFSAQLDTQEFSATDGARGEHEPAPACMVSSSGEEAVYAITAGSAGRMTFGTEGNNMDVVVYARAGDCATGEVLGCSNFAEGPGQEVVQIPVAAGDLVYFFVDAVGDSEGTCDVFALLVPN